MQAIVCVSANWGIGRDNELLFHIKPDLQRFRALTLGKTIVMGRRTLESFPGSKPLPKRNNIVLSTTLAPREDVTVVRSIEELLPLCDEDAFLCGGEQVYRALLPYCTRVLVTKVDSTPEADAYFPDLDADGAWRVESMSEEQEADGLRFRYIDYVKA